MNTQKQHGFSALIIVLLIALVGVIGFVGWRMYDSSQQSSSQQATQNTNNQTQEPVTDPNEGYVVIKEWGVRFKPVEGLEGVQYYRINDNNDFFAFTTSALAKSDKNCGPGNDIVLAGILKSKENDGDGKKHGPINAHFYYTRASSASCSIDQNTINLLGQSRSKLLTSLDSLEAAK